jgi:hypothetical protein
MAEEDKTERYTIIVECLVPTVLKFQVEAESPEEALDIIKRKNPNNIDSKVHSRINTKQTVFNQNTSNVRLVKHGK